MYTGWIKPFALAALLAVASSAFGQGGPSGGKPGGDKADQKPPGDKSGKDKEAPKTKLEEMIQQALRNNPDIRVAEAKVAEADAELNRTRLVVMQKVVLYNANLTDAKAKVELAERRYERLVAVGKSAPGAVSTEDLQAAEAELQTAKANLAKIEAELPLLLGDKTQDKAIEKGLEWLRRYSLDTTGDQLDRATAEQWMKFMHANTVDTNTAFALAALAAAGVKPPVQGPMADRIKKALDRPIKVDFNAIGPRDALDWLLEKVEGVPFNVRLKESELSPEVLHFKFDHEVPLGAAFQAYQDVCSPSVRLVVRDYGILVTDDKHVPPGATLLYDLWKGGQEKAKSDKPGERSAAPQKVEGTITKVDAKAGMVSVSVGSDAGLRKGDMLHVYRLGPAKDPGPKYLGQITIVAIQPTEAVCERPTRPGAVPEVGDLVTNVLPDK
jgi:hypothetical protein